MILGFLIAVFLTIMNLFVSLLPPGIFLPDYMFSAAVALAQPLADVSWFLPVVPLINVILATIPLMFAILIFRIFLFFLGVIRRVDYARHHGYM